MNTNYGTGNNEGKERARETKERSPAEGEKPSWVLIFYSEWIKGRIHTWISCFERRNRKINESSLLHLTKRERWMRLNSVTSPTRLLPSPILPDENERIWTRYSRRVRKSKEIVQPEPLFRECKKRRGNLKPEPEPSASEFTVFVDWRRKWKMNETEPITVIE